MRCIYPFVSMTSVQRAVSAFERSHIPYKIVELAPEVTQRGCAFGIEISYKYLDLAEKSMKNSGIKYKEHIEL